MKDLYRRFALSPSASPETIRARLEVLPVNVDAIAAKEILLNADRKRVYDRAYATAAKIGYLELNLKLPVDEPTREFRSGQPEPRTEVASFVQSNGQATSPNVSAANGRMFKGQIFAHPAIGAFVAIIFVLI